jgi:ABC-2 type transport system permease protein
MVIKLMKKELNEYLKTGKFYILLFVFVFFAILSPVTAKFMPEIIKSMSQGISITIPPPTWRDSFVQFSKNLNQIVFIVIVLVFLGSVAEEKNHGTASLVAVKGIDRRKWVFSKFLFQFLFSLVILTIAFFLCFYYAKLLFHDTQFYPAISSTILFVIYLFFVLSLTIFSSSIGKSMLQSAGVFFAIFIVLNILNIIPQVNPYNPMTLSSIENQWIVSKVVWGDTIKPIISTVLLSLILIFSGTIYFHKQEL